jgi:hypothetical protein
MQTCNHYVALIVKRTAKYFICMPFQDLIKYDKSSKRNTRCIEFSYAAMNTTVPFVYSNAKQIFLVVCIIHCIMHLLYCISSAIPTTQVRSLWISFISCLSLLGKYWKTMIKLYFVTCLHSPVVGSHNRAVLSLLAVRIRVPCGLKHA